MSTTQKKFLAGAGTLALLASLAIGVLFASGTFAQDPPKPPFGDERDAPTPGRSFQFIDGTVGRFRVATWDDRNLTNEEKAADPVFNPAWEPFGECVRGRGVSLPPQAGQRLTQADLDGFVERRNAQSPRRDENLDLAAKKPAERTAAIQARPHQRDAAVFLDCAEEWLTLSPQALYERTGEPNEYYPPR